MAKVYLVLLTYAGSADSPRAEYAHITLENALENIVTSHDLIVHIADDGSDPKHIKALTKIAKDSKFDVSHTNANRGGYGASFNLATQYCHYTGDYFIMLEDDWKLVNTLDLDPLIEALDAGLGCIRLGYLGWTNPLHGTIKKYANQSFLEFDPNSEETHVWSGHPRIETVAYQRRVGPWPEGIGPGETEFAVANRSEARIGVAWPLDASINASQQYANMFAHIGAIQARIDQNVGIEA
jgi:hypothetical protein